MESVILPCKSLPTKSGQVSLKSPKPTVSFNIKPNCSDPKLTDTHLKYLCKNDHLSEAIDFVAQCGREVSSRTLSYLIEACTEVHSLNLGRKLHAHINNVIQHVDPFVATKLIGMYAKNGSLVDAFEVFDEMRVRNLYSWSAMIGACSREKKWVEVVELFYSMVGEGDVVPDDFLFPKILQACGHTGDVETGKLIHGIVVKLGMIGKIRVSNSVLAVYAKCGCLISAKRFFHGMETRDRVSWNAIITGYCQVGKMNDARRLFDLMREDGVNVGVTTWNILISSYNQFGHCDVAMEMMKEMESHGIMPDVFTWTSMVSGFSQNNREVEALALFKEMLFSGVKPNGVTLTTALSACASLKDLNNGREFHLLATKCGYAADVLVGNSLIDMYSKCGKLEVARRVFDKMSEKDIYTWNSMIGGYCRAGYCGKAHDLFMKMKGSNVSPNVITWNVMITGYIQNGDEDQAMDLFQKMEKDGGVKQDTASWNALIAGYLQHGLKDKALGIFRQMQLSGFKPNAITILSILPACTNIIAGKKVKEIHACILHYNLGAGLSVANCLIDTYAKSGDIKSSKAIFDVILTKDIITWNTMITGYVIHGCSRDAIQLFEVMVQEGYKPNRGTFMSMISAYGQAKMVAEGIRLFFSMTEEYHISPGSEHYAAMIHLFGRSGKLNEAFKFVKDMAVEPDVSIWSALLTASLTSGNIKLAVYAGERLLQLESENALIKRLVLQLHDLCGNSKDPLMVRRHGKLNEPMEHLGWSWIEDKNMVHTFRVGDRHQLNDKDLLSWVKSLEVKTKVPSYYKGLSIEDEEKEPGRVHSEKLALAFALTKSSQIPKIIRIAKNLRICENCHRIMKLVSQIYECEIYLNDSQCLHHFIDGSCSCDDYW